MATVKGLHLGRLLETDGLKPVYALVGDDEALVSLCISQIKAAAELPELSGSVTTELEDAPEPSAVFDELRTQPFMGLAGLRVVIVRQGDEFLSAHGDLVAQYLRAPSPSGVLVVWCNKMAPPREPAKPSGRAELVADEARAADRERLRQAANAIRRVGLVVECGRVQWKDARSWLQAEARHLGKGLTPRASSALVEAVGPNVSALRNELHKLALYAADEPTITERDVDEVVPESRLRSIFELSDAIARSEAGRAVELGEELLLRGERPEGIVAFLGRQMRVLWQVKKMLAAGASQQEVARSLNIPGFAAGKAAAATQRLTDLWFEHKIELLAAADMELKTALVQSRELRVWLGTLLARMCRSGPR